MLKKELMIPGVRVVVNDVIKDGIPANLGGGSTLDGISIMPSNELVDALTAPLVGAGTVLEIVKKPRKRENVNLVRVKVVATGLEGEVWWCTLRASCRMAPL